MIWANAIKQLLRNHSSNRVIDFFIHVHSRITQLLSTVMLTETSFYLWVNDQIRSLCDANNEQTIWSSLNSLA